MEAKKSSFLFNGYRVLESSISLAQESHPSSKMNVHFGIEGTDDSENHMYNLIVSSHIEDADKIVKIDIKMLGQFEYKEELPDDIKEQLFGGNGPAILFPYIRAYVSAMTSLAGISPIILPTVNFAKMALDKKNKQ